MSLTAFKDAKDKRFVVCDEAVDDNVVAVAVEDDLWRCSPIPPPRVVKQQRLFVL